MYEFKETCVYFLGPPSTVIANSRVNMKRRMRKREKCERKGRKGQKKGNLKLKG
jgi:hypothetical protein